MADEVGKNRLEGRPPLTRPSREPPAPPRIVRTERLVLRPPRTVDAERIFDGYARDPEVVRYLFWAPHRRIGDTHAFLLDAIRAWEGGRRFPWIMAPREGPDDVLGMVELRLAEVHAAEAGFVLERDAWNRGFMTEALIAVLETAFEIPGIRRVAAYCHVDNRGSARVMEKAGMRREGLLRKYAIFPNLSEDPADCWLYAAVR